MKGKMEEQSQVDQVAIDIYNIIKEGTSNTERSVKKALAKEGKDVNKLEERVEESKFIKKLDKTDRAYCIPKKKDDLGIFFRTIEKRKCRNCNQNVSSGSKIYDETHYCKDCQKKEAMVKGLDRGRSF